MQNLLLIFSTLTRRPSRTVIGQYKFHIQRQLSVKGQNWHKNYPFHLSRFLNDWNQMHGLCDGIQHIDIKTCAILWSVPVPKMKTIISADERQYNIYLFHHTRTLVGSSQVYILYADIQHLTWKLTWTSCLETAPPCPIIWLFIYAFASFQAAIVCVFNSSSVNLEPLLPSCHTHWKHHRKTL